MTKRRAGAFVRRSTTVVGAVGLVMVMAGGALGAVPLTQISFDPYTNTTSFHRTQVEPDTYSFGSTIVATFQTGRFSDGGASNAGWATSSNSGANWTNGFLPGTTTYATPPGPLARVSDPAVAYDARHGVWLINTLGLNASIIGKAVLVNRSTNGGTTWGNPVTVAQGGPAASYDKNWITCDNTATSPAYGNCYVEWDDNALGNLFKMSRSTDGGLTWSASSVPADGVIGGQPLVQPSGKVVVPISNAFGSTLLSYVSTNGGISFTGPFSIASIFVHGVAGSLRDGNGLSSAEVDAAGRVYVVWHDCRFRSGCSANDIVMSTSLDGQTWTQVKRLPIAPVASSVDAFIPGIGVDRATSGAGAHLAVTFYGYPQSSCSVSTCRLYAGFISSTDGGATWGSPSIVLGPIRMAWLPLTTQGYMVGDYISTSIAGGVAFPVLANATNGSCQVGQITSCHEFAVAPTGGLPVIGGSHPAESPPTVGTSAAPRRHTTLTAY